MYKKISSNGKRFFLSEDSDEVVLDMLAKTEEALARSNTSTETAAYLEDNVALLMQEIEDRELKYGKP